MMSLRLLGAQALRLELGVELLVVALVALLEYCSIRLSTASSLTSMSSSSAFSSNCVRWMRKPSPGRGAARTRACRPSGTAASALVAALRVRDQVVELGLRDLLVADDGNGVRRHRLGAAVVAAAAHREHGEPEGEEECREDPFHEKRADLCCATRGEDSIDQSHRP